MRGAGHILPPAHSIWATDLATAIRINGVPPAAPDQPAGMDRVGQCTVTAGRTAADRGVVPQAARRSRHRLRVQRAGDRKRAGAGGVIPQDPLNDRSLGRLDLAQAALRLPAGAKFADDAIAVGRRGVSDSAFGRLRSC